MSQWVVEKLGPDMPMHFSAFHPDYKMMDVPPTPSTTLFRARRIALDNGVRYAFTGNINDEEGGSTWCHHCGELLIGRRGYTLTHWGLTPAGTCQGCGTACAGVFEAQPGSWGSRFQSVRLSDFRESSI